MTRTRDDRTGFTLTELMVAMAVIIVLAAIAAAVVPGALSQDRTTDGAAIVRQYLMIAKNRAARDNLPRGLRFIISADPTNPNKNIGWSTEMQEIEAPEVLVPNIIQTTRANTHLPPVNPVPVNSTGVQPDASPHVEIVYTLGDGVTAPFGTILRRQIFLRKLTNDHASGIQVGGMVGIPEFNNYWGRIESIVRVFASTPVTSPGTFDVEITVPAPPTSLVNEYPDDYMGASTRAVSYRFGLYAPPQPLLASSVVPLPRNIAVDLTQSNPTGTPPTVAPSSPQWLAGQNYDILFAPNGQVINGIGRPAVQGQVYLWVRDITKVANPIVQTGVNAGEPVYDVNVFRSAGEQQIVALKAKTGALGVFPVLWPQEGTGQYATPFAIDPTPWYGFARLGATGP